MDDFRRVRWGEGAEADGAVELHEPIWGFFLDNIVACLDGGEDLRPSAPMGQIDAGHGLTHCRERTCPRDSPWDTSGTAVP